MITTDMASSKTAEDKFRKLIDVNKPIIFIQDYDFVRVDFFLRNTLCYQAGDNDVNSKIKEWNPATDVTTFTTKESIASIPLLDFLKSEYYLGESRIKEDANEDNDDLDFRKPKHEQTAPQLPERYLVLKQIQKYLESAEYDNIRTLLLLIAQRRLYDPSFNTTIIIVCSSNVRIPEDLSKYVTTFEFDFPSDKDIESLIGEHIEVNRFNKEKFGDEDRNELKKQLKGMTAFEIDRMLDMAMSVGGTLSKDDSEMIFDQKKAMVKQAGILQLVDSKLNLDSVGGMNALKEFLKTNSKIINDFTKAEEFGVSMPKGVFIVGMPGCGKSLCAKATATLFKAPLLKLDMGTMMGKYVGESEANLRKAIQIAEAAAPCVLWIDEIEKAFSGVGGEGSDVLTRMFGYFLGWMQDKESAVYVVGTANNAEKLPPELKRKGRFDEIFCVNLPCKEERESIFKVHLNKLKGKECLNGVDINSLASELSSDYITKGFNGADIEAVINDAVKKAFDENKNLKDVIRDVADDTISISESCSTQIRQMETTFKQNSFKDSNTGEITNK